ncbi:acyl-CoA dehydrogenase family protein [Cryptosporangium sp. NPDC051539]|uniref:acyl-CoA dehydrogenase family protein n=1 Tax=Cryptosporangium sp. NPDC051539 TaxID=3363962 RepID=UPI00378E462E
MNEIGELAEAVFGDAWPARGADDAGPDGTGFDGTGFDGALWTTCENTGLARLTAPEAGDGSGASFADAAEMLVAAGRFAARVPLAETDLAAWLLHTAGFDVPGGPLAVVVGRELEVVEGRATGTVTRVPWGRAVAAVVVSLPGRVLLVDTAADGVRVTRGANIAEEPRDVLDLARAPVAVGTVRPEASLEVSLRAALARAALLAGAASGALALAVRYAGQREQFGRPIGSFQAIQQSLALAAGEVAAARAAAEAAAFDADRFGVADASFAIAAARTRCAEAAGPVARIAHQVHGAIGVTREHDLRRITTRLWAWREEDEVDGGWPAHLGSRVTDQGTAGLWPLLAR